MTLGDNVPAPLPPPRFSLRTLFLLVTVIGVLLGLSWWLSPLAMLGVMLSTLAVGAHVLGNALGTKLRDGSSDRPGDAANKAPRGDSLPVHVPATNLGDRSSLGWGMLLATLGGVIAGILGGCVWIEYTYRIGFDPYGFAVAGVAFGLLGGFIAFALASFSRVLAVAVLQAMRHK